MSDPFITQFDPDEAGFSLDPYSREELEEQAREDEYFDPDDEDWPDDTWLTGEVYP